jgi:hypothetical protein
MDLILWLKRLNDYRCENNAETVKLELTQTVKTATVQCDNYVVDETVLNAGVMFSGCHLITVT